jgi:hypothetical protein
MPIRLCYFQDRRFVSEQKRRKGMRWIRVMALMGMLATAGIAGAQTAPAQATRQLPVQSGYVPPAVLRATGEEQCDNCPLANQTWYYRALLDASMAWQRLRTTCGNAKSAGCCDMPACCLADACKSAGCVVGIAGCAKGCATAQAPKSCCCAKECACCEMCKASKQKSVQIERVRVQPMPCPMQAPATGVFKIALPAPAMLPMMPACMPQNVMLPVNVGGTVKLVTPDFEVHCNHITQRGDTIELTGNVLLLCKKNSQPVRIEAQRILLNLNNGTYTAEAGVPATAVTMPMSMPMNIGFMRMSIGTEAVRSQSVPATGNRTQEAVRPATFVPASGIIEVVPVPQALPRPR